MRSLLGALAVVVVSVALLSRSVFAGDRAPTMSVPAKVVVEMLKKNPKTPTRELALARFVTEVLAAKTIEILPGSTDNAGLARDTAAQLMGERACGPLTAEELKSATALATEYGDDLSLELRAFTLGQQGKSAESAKLFSTWLDQLVPAGDCLSEHPDDAGHKMAQVSVAIVCLEKLAPKFDRTKAKKQEAKAFGCLANNHVVG